MLGSRHPLTVARGRRYVEKVLWCTDCNGNQLGADCPFLFSLDLGEDDQGRPIPPNFGSLQECTSWVGTKFNELMWGALKHDWGEGSSISDCPFLDASGWGECPDIDKVPKSFDDETKKDPASKRMSARAFNFELDEGTILLLTQLFESLDADDGDGKNGTLEEEDFAGKGEVLMNVW